MFAASFLPRLGHVPGDRLDDRAPCATRSWRWFFRSPTTRGSPTIRTPLATSSGRGLPIPCGSSVSISSTTCEREHPERDLGVDREDLLQLFGRERVAAMLVEPFGEDGKVADGELQARGGLVAAEADQALGAGLDRLVEVEAGDRPRRALADLVAQGDDDRRPVVGLDQAAGHDPDDARVPALAPQDDRAAVAQPPLGGDHLVRLGDDRLLDLLPPRVAAVELLGDLAGQDGVVGREHLDGPHRALEPARRVDPGGQAEADVPRRQPLLAEAAGDLHQGPQADRRLGEDPGQPVPDEDPVLVAERDDVGDGRQRHQADRPDQEVAEVRRGLLAVAEALADLPRELERHAGAAEVAAGVAAPGQPGVDDHVGLGQVGADRVVVGHDRTRGPAPAPAAPRGPPRSRNRP